MTMNTRTAGRKGGQSKSPAKIEAGRLNAAKARAARAAKAAQKSKKREK